ncbi:MAG: chitobiase/beta-hexosaminidase C-terminal domain-containing protein [Verrucomicrobiota bacterium]|jgi:sugar lactone lactonase YvrE
MSNILPFPIEKPKPKAIWGLLAAALFATPLHAQFVSTLISTNLLQPDSVAADAAGNLYVTDSADNRIVEYSPGSGTTSILAGGFSQPLGIVAARGGLVVVDQDNQLIRLVSFTGTVTNLAGTEGSVGASNGPGAGATFSYPVGIAADGAGNLYVADWGNNLIREIYTNNYVTNVATGGYQFNGPTAVAVDNNSNLWVADAGNEVICMVSNGVATVIAGATGQPGTNDATVATNAHFNAPGGLLWDTVNNRLLISDSGNGAIRSLFLSNSLYAVQTIAGTPGQPGNAEGLPGAAKFGYPVGICVDSVDSGFYIADFGNNSVRVLQPSAPQPPVSTPQIGYVSYPATANPAYTSVFIPSTGATFNNLTNIVIDAETGTQTYVSYGPTGSAIPLPGPGSTQPLIYPGDGSTASQVAGSALVFGAGTNDITIYAIGEANGRRPSAVASARFQFIAANPIITGDNAAAILLTDSTIGSTLYYTTDGSSPTNNGSSPGVASGTTLSLLITTNVTLEVRAFAAGFAASQAVSTQLTISNFVGNQVGFPQSHAAGIGATAILPIALAMAQSNAVLESIQFRVEVAPLGGNTNMISSLSLLPMTSGDFVPWLGPAPGNAPVNYVTLPYTSGKVQGLAIATQTNSGFSIQGAGVVALLEIPIPKTDSFNDQYSLSIINPSGTSDGNQANVPLVAMSNQTLTISNPRYLAGDSSPATGYDAGEFGDQILNNSDVNNALYASALIRVPPVFSDAHNAMDVYPPPAGDGQITFLDWVTILRRSLGLDPNYCIRYRTNNGVIFQEVTNWTNSNTPIPLTAPQSGSSGTPGISKESLSNTPPGLVWLRQAVIGAETETNVAPGSVCSIPVYVKVSPGYSLAGLQFRAILSAEGGAPAPGAIAFSPAGGVPTPIQLPGLAASDIVCAWAPGAFSQSLQNRNYLGVITFRVPSAAQAGQSYAVHFVGVDGAPDTQTSYQLESFPGWIWVNSAALQPPQISSDEWRVFFFGSLTNSLAADNVDADGDGMPNWMEYLAGTDPTDPLSRFQFTTAGINTNGIGGVGLGWLTAPGKTYVLESIPVLGGTHWTAINTNVGDGNNYQFVQTNYSGASRFYQLRLQP